MQPNNSMNNSLTMETIGRSQIGRPAMVSSVMTMERVVRSQIGRILKLWQPAYYHKNSDK